MKRRDFLQKSLGAGIAAGAFGLINPTKVAGRPLMPDAAYDMVALKGGNAATMFDRGIQELGGIKSFVKANETVTIKPNIGWDAQPERAANTNPELVGRIVQHCISAGAKTVYVFDNTCNEWTKCYKNSGIEEAVKSAGGKMVTGNSESHYHEVSIPGGKKLKSAKVHELALESDVFINVPVLKSHGGATLTIAMKNLMGIVWDRRFWHANDLHQCIVDFAAYFKPDLNIVDAYRVLKRNGPRGVSVNDVVELKSQLITRDILAADVAGTKLFGLEPERIGYLEKAKGTGIGTHELSNLNIKRITV